MPAPDVLTALGDVCAHAGPADTAAGVRAGYLARPGDAGQVADVLRAAAAHRLAVVPRGAGTRLSWGLPPTRADVILDLSALDRVVDHAAGDLVLVAEAGARISAVQRQLAAAGQRLPVDAPTPGATLGGTVATGHSGPSRLLAGPIKDQLIGLSMVRADGTPASAGGRVVKNVAGYDLGRLMCGSYGTLAVLTRVIFRLRPLPAARAFVTAPILGPSLAAPLIESVVTAQLAPSAVELHLPAPPRDDDPAATPVRSSLAGAVVVLVEGSPAGVAARASAVRELLREAGAAQVHVHTEPPPWWGTLPGRDDPHTPGSPPADATSPDGRASRDDATPGGRTLPGDAAPDGRALRGDATPGGRTLPGDATPGDRSLPGDAAPDGRALRGDATPGGRALPGDGAASEHGTLLRLTFVRSGLPAVLSAARDAGATVSGSAAAGVLTAALPSGSPGRVATALTGLRAVCAGHGGTAIVLDAPAPVRDAVDVWGPVPALDLMRRVKERFDPDHRLSPGRFVGGI